MKNLMKIIIIVWRSAFSMFHCNFVYLFTLLTKKENSFNETIQWILSKQNPSRLFGQLNCSKIFELYVSCFGERLSVFNKPSNGTGPKNSWKALFINVRRNCWRLLDMNNNQRIECLEKGLSLVAENPFRSYWKHTVLISKWFAVTIFILSAVNKKTSNNGTKKS